jgi:hypothetical protein
MTGSELVTHNNIDHRWLRRALPIAICIALAAPQAVAGAREQAKQIHDRLAGVPPSASVLDAMEQDILANDPAAAAARAMDNDAFYSVTLKNFATPWTNEEQTVFAPLNDYTATVIGMVRDGVDFREILSGNVIYTGSNSPAYSNTSNAHYEAMEQQGLALGTVLVAHTQTEVTGLAANATAGVITTRQAAKAFFKDGTNRAMFRFTLMNHLCHDLEQVKDTTRTPDRIRQDVTRSPGGDSRVFLNACIGCHSGMDPMAQAFAYYNYSYDMDADEEGVNGQLVYHGGEVDPKYHINSGNFRYGYVTPDDHWNNYWREGQNKVLGWDSGLSGAGTGAKSMGTELAHSDAFASCQVTKVFEAVCLRKPEDAADRAEINSMIGNFRSSTYKLKTVFSDAAIYCRGD